MSTKVVSARLEEESYNKLVEKAKKEGKPVSILVREIIKSNVNSSKQPENNTSKLIEILRNLR